MTGSQKRFALFPNLTKSQSLEVAKEIKNFLLEKGASVVTEDDKAQALSLPPLSSVEPKSIDFLISLGGDGTILRVIHHHPKLSAPIVGINMGSLGFMADIPIEEVRVALSDILEGKYVIKKRIVMQGTPSSQHSCFAVNEIVIHRVKNPCLIELAIHVGGIYLNTFSADGLIISTPNGSTAYSLAAGGPILAPELSALVITPICPHTISNRPIVVGADQEIQIEYLSNYEQVEVSYDGFPFHTLATGHSLKINLSDRIFSLVSFPWHNFYATLRKKLAWSGKLKS